MDSTPVYIYIYLRTNDSYVDYTGAISSEHATPNGGKYFPRYGAMCQRFIRYKAQTINQMSNCVRAAANAVAGQKGRR